MNPLNLLVTNNKCSHLLFVANLCRTLKSYAAFLKAENYDEVAIIHPTFRNLLKTNDFITGKYHGNAYLSFELFLLQLYARASYQF